MVHVDAPTAELSLMDQPAEPGVGEASLQRARGGDRAAFRELLRTHQARVFSIALRFTGRRADAEELAQDVFLQVYRARASYEPRARFATWLFRIATNTCLSEMRRPEHRRSMSSLDAEEDEDGEVHHEFPDPSAAEGESAALATEKREHLRRLLASLPPQQRAALLLARAEDFSYEEVSESLDCSVAAVKSLIHRATVALRNGMRDYESGED